MLAGRVLVTTTVVGLFAGGLLGLGLDAGPGFGVGLSVVGLLGATGLAGVLGAGTVTVCIVVGTAGVDVTLFCRFASEINSVATAAFSWWTASIAVRSSLNTPCLNLVGL